MHRAPSLTPLPFLRCGLAGLASALLLTGALPARALGPGDRVPEFVAPDLTRTRSVDLSAYRGKVVLIDFWASWCAPCLTSLPKLEALRQEFGAADFQIVAVNLDSEPEDALRFLEKHPVGYPSASDPQGALPESFGLSTMPSSYLIDRRGVIRYVHEGFRRGDETTLREHIRGLLAARR